MSEAQLTDIADVFCFVLAGNATFTLVSGRTGARFTYKARRPDPKGPDAVDRPVWFSVLSGTDNENDYAFIGTVFPGEFEAWSLKTSAKTKVSSEATSAKALAWFLRSLDHGVMPPEMQFWHEGKCCRCGRKLTVPESIAKGIGPDCEFRL